MYKQKVHRTQTCFETRKKCRKRVKFQQEAGFYDPNFHQNPFQGATNYSH